MFKVFIVDDEPYIRNGLKKIINWEKLGFELSGQAENGVQAFKKISKCRPNLIVTDIKMPAMNGLELIKKVNEELGNEFKFIVLSGYDEFEYAKEAMKYGVKNYLLKPIEEEELKDIVKEIYHELYEAEKEKRAKLEAADTLSDVCLRTVLKASADRESMENVKKFLNTGNKGYFRYIMMQTDNSMFSSTTLREYLAEILGQRYRHNIFKEDYNISEGVYYGIVMTEKLLKEYNNDIRYFTKMLFTELLKELKDVYIFAGKAVNELLLLKESYNSALFTHHMQIHKKRGNIIFYDDVKNVPIGISSSDVTILDDLVDAIDNRDENQMENIIGRCFGREDPVNLELMSIKLNYLLFHIIKIVSRMNGETAEILNFSAKLLRNSLIPTAEKKKNINDFCKNCAEYINALRENQFHGILYEVKKYIHENFDKSISIKNVAKQFYVNPAYLGQIFKKRYNITFHDYIHCYRIEKSKQLLKYSNLKIYEISEKVGYKSPDIFIKKFVKSMGITPLKYRKCLLN